VTATQSVRKSKPGTLFLGAFDNIKTNASEVAYLFNEAALAGAVFYADDTDKILRAMERIEKALSDIRCGLAYYRRRT